MTNLQRIRERAAERKGEIKLLSLSIVIQIISQQSVLWFLIRTKISLQCLCSPQMLLLQSGQLFLKAILHDKRWDISDRVNQWVEFDVTLRWSFCQGKLFLQIFPLLPAPPWSRASSNPLKEIWGGHRDHVEEQKGESLVGLLRIHYTGFCQHNLAEASPLHVSWP